MKQVYRIGPEQDELAMSKVEDAHHARDHAEAKHDQHKDCAVCKNVEKEWNYCHADLPALCVMHYAGMLNSPVATDHAGIRVVCQAACH